MPNTGLGMKVACRPNSAAMERTTHLKVTVLSAAVSASAYLKLISCWPSATSWWLASISKPMASSVLMILRRQSMPESSGSTSK